MNRYIYVPILLAVCCFVGCRSKASSGKSLNLDVAAPSPDSVPFTAIRTSTSADGTERWNANYSHNGKTAQFEFELSKAQSLSDPTLGFGHGRFISIAGSEDSDFLRELQTMLQAKHFPLQRKKQRELKFSYAVLGEHDSRLPGGGFTGKPQGDWRSMKLFLDGVADADDDEEVFFNLNPVAQNGEFAIKDPDYGDGVLTQLAKVL